MADAAVTFLLNQLSTWLGEEKYLLGGLRNEARLVQGQLEQMRAFLRDVDAKEETDLKLKEFVKQVREIAYEIEDVLESYMLLSGGRIPSGCIKKVYAPIKKLRTKHKLASEIKELRSRLEDAFKTFKDICAAHPGSSSSAVTSDMYYDGRGDALLLEEADVMGIEKPKNELLGWISNDKRTLQMISVVGMPGLGKTTLVKKVYDDSSIKENFDHHAWVTVSQTYKDENLLLGLIQQLLQEVKQALPVGLETMNSDGIREFIYKFLQNKKYVIILDDVWSTNAWEALRYAFPRRSTHGRGCIIITTRNNNIGDAACFESGDYVYHLQPLPQQIEEELFHTKVFRASSCPDHLKEISKNILRRCAGLPLAIVVIGGVLATKRNAIEEWEKLSLTFGFEVDHDPLKRMEKVLSLSYYDLPYYLKPCLLYLSIFPEDVLLEKATIIRLWIAEGFVEAKQERTMEDIADGYLNELSNRSLIQVATTSDDGRQRNFRIHDLVREYVISKAREQGLVAIKNQRQIVWEGRVRRLSLDDNFVSDNEKINDFKYLRTLLFFGVADLEWESIISKVLDYSCRMLKVLDLRGAPLDIIPIEVFKLYHLKYLSLRNTNVSIIPKLIGNLVKLEILDFKGCKVVELPIEILMLRRLRVLLVYRYKRVFIDYVPFEMVQGFGAPCEIGQLFHLEKLCYIDASANIVREIGKLIELRRLGIEKLRKEDGLELCSSLKNLTHLSSLSISSLEEGEVVDLQYHIPPTCLKFLRVLVLEGCLQKLPQWISSLKALKDLRLRRSRLDEDPLEYLQNLPNLEILGLNRAYEGEGLSFNSRGFQRLTKLSLGKMRGLRWVKVEKGCMPGLKTLEMLDCKAMMELPMGIEHLTELEEVEFTDMGEEFVEKLLEERRREGDQWKLAHVPDFSVGNYVNGQWKSLWL